MDARVDQLCIRLIAGIVDVVLVACLCKVNSAHTAARCFVFQDHSAGSGDVGIFGDCSFVITDGNGDILGLVDRQVFRCSTVGTLNGHVTTAGDSRIVIHRSCTVCINVYFAGIYNIQLPFTAMNPPLISTSPVQSIVLVSSLAIIAASSLLLTFTLCAFSTINFAATAI